MPRAYDFVGNMVSPAEVFPRLDALASMAQILEDAGHTDAATETREYLAEAQAFAQLATRRMDRLRGVWRAVEMEASPYSTGDRAVRIGAAVDAYRELRAEA